MGFLQELWLLVLVKMKGFGWLEIRLLLGAEPLFLMSFYVLFLMGLEGEEELLHMRVIVFWNMAIE